MKRQQGLIIKCDLCGCWHYKTGPCVLTEENTDFYLYDPKESLISKSEQGYYEAIKSALPEDNLVFPQINLASFIERTDNSRYHNELFRNVDFLITDKSYAPKAVVEINDQSHLDDERKKRDEKVKNICEEAGIPVIKFWTSFGVNQKYISEKLSEVLGKNDNPRIHHFKNEVPLEIYDDENPAEAMPVLDASKKSKKKKNGCYIATCVYGSYDCPEVWILRRYRDKVLRKTRCGRLFVSAYYAISPKIVKLFGKSEAFKRICKIRLDKFILKLKSAGLKDTPYRDNP